MSNEPKPCPNPKCKSEDVEAAYPDRGRSWVFCGDCGMRGPSVKCDNVDDDVEVTMTNAEAAWNALPREGEPVVTPEVKPESFEELAGRIERFQKILAGSGNSPLIEKTLLGRLVWLMAMDDPAINQLSSVEIGEHIYMGLPPKEPST